MYGMATVSFFPPGGAFHRALIFMLKLGWKSRFRLPVLMVAAFVVMDIRMQLEIDFHVRNDIQIYPQFCMVHPRDGTLVNTIEDLLIMTSTRNCVTESYWRLTIFFTILIGRATAAGLLNLIHDPILSPPSMSNSLEGTGNGNGVGIPCFIEYQVTQRKAGQCVKLGGDVRGCLADSYINPFHPDCS